jgi:hypothetical protein
MSPELRKIVKADNTYIIKQLKNPTGMRSRPYFVALFTSTILEDELASVVDLCAKAYYGGGIATYTNHSRK